MREILITGGAGFIGSHLCIALTKLGYYVTVLDNLSPQIHGNTSPLFESIKHQVNFIKGDVRNKADWLKAIKRQKAIIHLAAETGTGQSMYEIENYIDVNVKGTAILLDILTNKSHSVSKMIVASSRAIYGEGSYLCNKHHRVFPIARKDYEMKAGDFNVKCPSCSNIVEPIATDEESIIHPTSIYGISKQNQEQMFLVTGKAIGVPAVALRYQNVYGPGQSLTNPYTGILSIFSTRIKNNCDIDVFEDGLESRDFVYISDVVEATVAALERDEANYNYYNVGSGVPTSVHTVASTLKQNFNTNIEIKVTGNYRVGDIRHNFADISKIKADLDFIPRVDFNKGINLFCEWVNKQEVQVDLYENSIKEMQDKGLFK